MDSTICGLNKVICRTLNDSDNGKSVSITNGINTWTATVADKVAAFLIPSIPVPARKTYTVSFGEFSRDIQMGYGDIIEVVLAEGHEPIVGADLLTLDQMNAEGADLKYKGVEATGIKAIYDSLEKRTKAGDIEFEFGVLPDGRYGYKKAGADTVTPFRTGQETFCYKLGQGRNFDVKAACKVIHDTYGIDVDYTKLTTANFILSNETYSNTFFEDWSPTNTYPVDQYVSLGYNKPTASYNSGTGTLTVSNGSVSLSTSRRVGGMSAGGHSWGTTNITVNAYLIVSMN